MAEILGIVSACGLVAVIGLAIASWERHERRRLVHARLRRRPGRRSAPPPGSRLGTGRAA